MSDRWKDMNTGALPKHDVMRPGLRPRSDETYA
jgi:hypothetical protein